VADVERPRRGWTWREELHREVLAFDVAVGVDSELEDLMVGYLLHCRKAKSAVERKRGFHNDRPDQSACFKFEKNASMKES
jgi:hypothetical protein